MEITPLTTPSDLPNPTTPPTLTLHSTTLDSSSPLYPHIPGLLSPTLTSLTVIDSMLHVPPSSLSTLLLPSLTSLCIIGSTLPPPLLSTLLSSASHDIEVAQTPSLPPLSSLSPSLTSLRIAHTRLSNAGLRTLLASPLPSLSSLSLVDVGIGPAGGSLLAQTPNLPSLTQLVVQSGLGRFGLAPLLDREAPIWTHSPALAKLVLAKNHVGQDDLNSLHQAADALVAALGPRPVTLVLTPQQTGMSTRDVAYFGKGLDEWNLGLGLAASHLSPHLSLVVRSWMASVYDSRLEGLYFGYSAGGRVPDDDLPHILRLAECALSSLGNVGAPSGLFLEGLGMDARSAAALAAAIDHLSFPLENISTLVLRDNALDPNAAALLGPAIKKAFPSLTALDLTSNPLEDAGLEALLSSLKGLPLVVFSAGDIGATVDGVQSLLPSFVDFPTLAELDLWDLHHADKESSGHDDDDDSLLDSGFVSTLEAAGVTLILTPPDPTLPSDLAHSFRDESDAPAPYDTAPPTSEPPASTPLSTTPSDLRMSDLSSHTSTVTPTTTPSLATTTRTDGAVRIEVLLEILEQLDPPSPRILTTVTSLTASIRSTQQMLDEARKESTSLASAVAETHREIAAVQDKLKQSMILSSTSSLSLSRNVEDLDTERFVLRDRLRSLNASSHQLLSLEADLLSSLLDEATSLVEIAATHARPSQWAMLQAAGIASRQDLEVVVDSLRGLARRAELLSEAEDRASSAAVEAAVAAEHVKSLERQLAEAQVLAAAAAGEMRTAEAARSALRDSVAQEAASLNLSLASGVNKSAALARRLDAASDGYLRVFDGSDVLIQGKQFGATVASASAADLTAVHTQLAQLRSEQLASEDRLASIDRAQALSRSLRTQMGEVDRLRSRLSLLEDDRSTAVSTANLMLYKDTQIAYNHTMGALANAEFDLEALRAQLAAHTR